MTVRTRFFTWLNGEQVGTDPLGNRYFRHKKAGDRRRWVLFNGEAEASRVPPEWHAWLHYTTDEFPRPGQNLPWQRPHQENLTGTPEAYKPAGSMERGGHRAAATGDYEAWRPE
jgi:NADH:ubiquinone oxidoreductase subunit